MTKPMRLAEFQRLPPSARAEWVEGLPAAIDSVAERAPATHRFLRHGWYAAALEAYGGAARTLLVSEADVPVLALPVVRTGPAVLGIASVPGSYWPFRAPVVAGDASDGALAAGLAALARRFAVLRVGPVYDGDPVVAPLVAAARAAGWVAVPRFVAGSWLLDMAAAQADGPWPRGSTLRKNRFHEKHLAAHGTLDWSFATGADWPATFDALAAVEEKSWIAARTDGSDAKFTKTGHGAFWRAAVRDPAIAAMCRAALLAIDGAPAAFSFDLESGPVKYAIANSYDPAVAKHSPGKLLYWRNLVEALGRGLTLVDWGAGDSGYKRVLGATEGPAIRDWLLFRPGIAALAGRVLGAAWRGSGNAHG